jgi:muconate cycloisomerase
VRVEHGTVAALRLPLVEEFAHALSERDHSDSIVVEMIADDDTTGYGEGIPRDYVTGESVDAAIDHVAEVLWPCVRGLTLPRPLDPTEGVGALRALTDALPIRSSVDGLVVAWNAARCAVELALIDACTRASSVSVGQLLPPVRDHVVYCGVMPTGSVELAERHARFAKLMGAKFVKVKVGADDVEHDRRRLRAIRGVLGPEVSLTVDANAGYSVDQAIMALREFEQLDISGVEQPVPRGDPDELAAVRRESQIPIIVDESLVTLEDAHRLVEAGACDVFSIRISKCGGIVPSMEIAEFADAHGVAIKIGCHVGESALLSAAGRHLAAHLPHLTSVEGSFGTMLLAEDISQMPIHFGHGGRAPLLRRPGLGVDVDPGAIARHTHRAVRMGRS